jgi:hypothetical protein
LLLTPPLLPLLFVVVLLAVFVFISSLCMAVLNVGLKRGLAER